jgi:hypothetical protein
MRHAAGKSSYQGKAINFSLGITSFISSAAGALHNPE